MSDTLGLVKITARDFTPARSFYRDVLGLAETVAAADYRWAQYDTGPVPVRVCVTGLDDGDGSPGGVTGMQLRPTDARAAHVRLTARGGHPGPIEAGDDGTIRFDVVDPDGNRFDVAQVPTEP